MAIAYPNYELAEALGEHELHIQASTVGQLLAEIERRNPEAWKKHGAGVTVLVNGVSINLLKGPSTPLGPDDEVWFVLPAGGG